MELSGKYSTEEQFQADCMIWYRNSHKEDYQMCFAVDNNPSPRLPKHLRMVDGNRKKSIGIRDGVLDIVYIGWEFVAFIDFKLIGGDFSPNQFSFVEKAEMRGHLTFKVYPPLQNFIDLIHKLERHVKNS